MRRAPLFLSVMAATLLGAMAALLVPRAGAQHLSPSQREGGPYQLEVLPGAPDGHREWLVLDTRTGEQYHWRTVGAAEYDVNTLSLARTGPDAVKRLRLRGSSIVPTR